MQYGSPKQILNFVKNKQKHLLKCTALCTRTCQFLTVLIGGTMCFQTFQMNGYIVTFYYIILSWTFKIVFYLDCRLYFHNRLYSRKECIRKPYCFKITTSFLFLCKNCFLKFWSIDYTTMLTKQDCISFDPFTTYQFVQLYLGEKIQYG